MRGLVPSPIGIVGAARADRLAAAVDDVGAHVPAAQVDLLIGHPRGALQHIDRRQATVAAGGLEPLAQRDAAGQRVDRRHLDRLRRRAGELRRIAEAPWRAGGRAVCAAAVVPLPAPSRNDVAPSGSSSGSSSAGAPRALTTLSGVKAISAEAMPVCTLPCSLTAPPSAIGWLIWVRVAISAAWSGWWPARPGRP